MHGVTSPSPGFWLRVIGGAVLVAPLLAAAQSYTNKSWVMDTAGGWSSAGAFSNLSAAGQAGGAWFESAVPWENQEGFLQTFCLRPGLDTDGDGLANEADSDNDNDGLKDVDEISGIAFSPLTPTDVNDADTDNDGSSDGEEAGAGTDPTDPNASLQITATKRSGADVLVSWRSRMGKTYRLLRSDDFKWQGPWQTGGTVNVSTPGYGPWQVQTSTWTDVSLPVTSRLYRVKTP